MRRRLRFIHEDLDDSDTLEIEKVDEAQQTSGSSDTFDSTYKGLQIKNLNATTTISSEPSPDSSSDDSPSPDSGTDDSGDDSSSGNDSDVLGGFDDDPKIDDVDKPSDDKDDKTDKSSDTDDKKSDTSSKEEKDDESKDDTKKPKDTDTDKKNTAAVERFLELHNYHLHYSHESDDGEGVGGYASAAVGAVGGYAAAALSKTWELTKDGASYLKDLGIEYGPDIARNVKQGVIIASVATATAIIKGSVELTRYVRKRLITFKTFEDKSNKLLSAFADFDKSSITEGNSTFTNQDLIGVLKVGDSVDFDKGGKQLLTLLNQYYSALTKNVVENVAGTKAMVDKIANMETIAPLKMPVETIQIPDFVKKEDSNNQVPSENVESLMYKDVLPGDHIFIAFSPKKNLSNNDSIQEAYAHSKIFLTSSGKELAIPKEVKFIPIASVGEYIKTIQEITNHPIFKEKVFDDIVKSRDSLKPDIRKYFDHIYESKEAIDVKDSMVDFLNMKIRFMDSTYIAGSMMLSGYTLKYLSAATQYCKEALK